MESASTEKERDGARVSVDIMAGIHAAALRKGGGLGAFKDNIVDNLVVRLRTIGLLADATTSHAVRIEKISYSQAQESARQCTVSYTHAVDYLRDLTAALRDMVESGQMSPNNALLTDAVGLVAKYSPLAIMQGFEDTLSQADESNISTAPIRAVASNAMLHTAKMDSDISDLNQRIQQAAFVPESVKTMASTAYQVAQDALIDTTLATRNILLDTPITGTILKVAGAAHDLENATYATLDYVSDKMDAVSNGVKQAGQAVAERVQQIKDGVSGKLNSILEHASVFGRKAAKAVLLHVDEMQYTREVKHQLSSSTEAREKLSKSYEQMQKQMETLHKHVEQLYNVVEVSRQSGKLESDMQFPGVDLIRTPEGRKAAFDKFMSAEGKVHVLDAAMQETADKLQKLDKEMAHLPFHQAVLKATHTSLMDKIKGAWNDTVAQISGARQDAVALAESRLLAAPEDQSQTKSISGPRL